MVFRSYGRRGITHDPFEAALLPVAQKEQLCRELLAEFGAVRVTLGGRDRDELIHGCLISSYHRDQDRNPTASLNFEKLTYNCFGCGASGGLLWLIAECRETNTEQARQWLAAETGTEGNAMEKAALLAYFDALFSPKSRPPPIPRYSPRVLDAWMQIHPYLTEGVPELGLSGRGLDTRVIERFRVGWDPKADRIILPHFWKGHLVGWQSRRIWSDGSPKYLSSPDFPKDRTIFNAADPLIRDTSRPVVVVESMMTVYAHCSSWPVVSTFGAELTDRQVGLLAEFPRIVAFFDNDPAGWKATELLRDQLDSIGSVVYVVENPYTGTGPRAVDAGDLPTEEFGRLVESSVYCTTWERPREEDLIVYEEAA